MEDLLSANKWLALSVEASTNARAKYQTGEDMMSSLREGVSFLLVGTSRGYLTILNPHTGVVVCSVHGETGIRGGADENEDDDGGGDDDVDSEEDCGIYTIACNCKRNQIATVAAGK